MKHIHRYTVATIALCLAGCGGTGGGSNSAAISTPNVVPYLSPKPRVEAIVDVQPTNLQTPTDPKTGLPWTQAQLDDPTNADVKASLINPTIFGFQDPMNIEAGEHMLFQLVNYTSANGQPPYTQRNILQGASFTSTDQASVFGVLAGNTGVYIAGNNISTVPMYVTATYSGYAGAQYGTMFSTQFAVVTRQARLLGNVFDTNNNPVPGAVVQFFNGNGSLADSVVVQADGSFRASTPITTATFTIYGDSLPSTDYHSFSYMGNQYDTSSGCPPTVSNLSVGTITMPANIIVALNTGKGPPAASPCGSSVKIIKR